VQRRGISWHLIAPLVILMISLEVSEAFILRTILIVEIA